MTKRSIICLINCHFHHFDCIISHHIIIISFYHYSSTLHLITLPFSFRPNLYLVVNYFDSCGIWLEAQRLPMLSDPICEGFWLGSDFAEIYTCHTLSHFTGRSRKWEEKRKEWRKSWLCGHRSFFVYFHLLINALLSLCTRQFGLLGAFSYIDLAWKRELQTQALAFFTKNCIVPPAIDWL